MNRRSRFSETPTFRVLFRGRQIGTGQSIRTGAGPDRAAVRDAGARRPQARAPRALRSMIGSRMLELVCRLAQVRQSEENSKDIARNAQAYMQHRQSADRGGARRPPKSGRSRRAHGRSGRRTRRGPVRPRSGSRLRSGARRPPRRRRRPPRRAPKTPRPEPNDCTLRQAGIRSSRVGRRSAKRTGGQHGPKVRACAEAGVILMGSTYDAACQA